MPNDSQQPKQAEPPLLLCPECKGSGKEEYCGDPDCDRCPLPCRSCRGTGYMSAPEPPQAREVVTIWFCDYCEQSGAVEHDRHIGVTDGVRIVQDAHSARNSDCNGRSKMLRVMCGAEEDVDRILTAAWNRRAPEPPAATTVRHRHVQTRAATAPAPSAEHGCLRKTVERLEQELVTARQEQAVMVAGLRKLHRRGQAEGGMWCHSCGTSYPCQTVKLLPPLTESEQTDSAQVGNIDAGKGLRGSR